MKEQLKKFIIDTFMYGKGTIDDNEPLFESGIIDSLGFVKLLAFIDETLKVHLNMGDITIEKFGTINQMTETIESKIKMHV